MSVPPRTFRVGPVTLDLMHRDARVGETWLRLRPREFAVLWRLAESAGQRVSRCALISDVWRLRHIPETNSLEVHVARLRAKLDRFGLRGLVETDPAGGYRLGH
ncbi:winged helix-turn-helix domain-containing protein [Tsuneonella mangrovi]|uniref:winged helix-turn-helix domain-containing protein n=1 Tax=Tsuneonella mangrovi TaxID=1982042 RepID=UPI001471EDDD|nr:winged helix-turn-helix domain-containing protein [Tsuneonella mangrovi]